MIEGTVQTIDLSGNRVVRVGAYTLDSGDGDPQPRVFISTGWRSVPLTPFAAETVDIPESALPELIEALEDLR